MIVVADEVRDAQAVVALSRQRSSRTASRRAKARRSGSSPSGGPATPAAPCRRRSASSTASCGSAWPEELERFGSDARKVGARDLAAACVQGAVGATTVGGTLAVARAAGLRVMATGGSIGGVHRAWQERPDVSADLGDFARTHAIVSTSRRSRCRSTSTRR